MVPRALTNIAAAVVCLALSACVGAIAGLADGGSAGGGGAAATGGGAAAGGGSATGGGGSATGGGGSATGGGGSATGGGGSATGGGGSATGGGGSASGGGGGSATGGGGSATGGGGSATGGGGSATGGGGSASGGGGGSASGGGGSASGGGGGSASGGGSATGGGSGTDGGATLLYSTNFPLTENPISEGGKWVTGKTDGLDWNDPETASGTAFASVLSGATGNRYDDSIAHLKASYLMFNPDQYAQGTVYRAAGYDPSPSKHEVELHLRWQTTAHNAQGYEVMWGITGYLAIVRWNGPLGSYTPLYDSGDPGIGPPADGDVLRVEIRGNTLTVYKNGSIQPVNTTDVTSAGGTVWSSGQPGLGFWPVDSATRQSYGWKSYQAGNL